MTEDFDATASELRFALFRLTRRLRRVRAVDAMSDAQLAALGALRAHGRRTISGLAEHERVTAPTMSATVSGLEELGLVRRVPDEDDRRRVHVELTEQGEKLVIATIRRRDEALAEMIRELDLDDGELATLRAAAAVLRKVAES
ncbi:MarR family transcriptional regulator [Microbacterium sp. ARD32]|uniref:MarR family winged helix-turn-helix transcriptional regulator n=1 Tax=Microbacterium sp. ARD32 TaxID=2962577 RepID=UPI002881F41F|nr:MarR family transcriptional regulator [Microbacterium sp. ARD32]MDT0158187.1 MarR family transcriptional regulator [Microbacterium sp. ARD32]